MWAYGIHIKVTSLASATFVCTLGYHISSYYLNSKFVHAHVPLDLGLVTQTSTYDNTSTKAFLIVLRAPNYVPTWHLGQRRFQGSTWQSGSVHVNRLGGGEC